MTTQIPRLLDENEALKVFLDAQAGSSKPIGVLRGIRAVIAWWEGGPQVFLPCAHRLTDALAAPGCERVKDFYADSPAQRAAVESFVDALGTPAPTLGESAMSTQFTKRKPLTVDEYTAIAHRTAATYAHNRGPSYTFLPLTLEHFTRALEAAHGIKEPT